MDIKRKKIKAQEHFKKMERLKKKEKYKKQFCALAKKIVDDTPNLEMYTEGALPDDPNLVELAKKSDVLFTLDDESDVDSIVKLIELAKSIKMEH